jgi:hypothetical protein
LVLFAAARRSTALTKTAATAAFAYAAFTTILVFVGTLIYVPNQTVGLPSAAVLLLLTWLAARIFAKTLVERHRKPEGQFLLIAAPLIATVVTICVVTTGPMAWHAWAAGLAAGYVIRDKRPNPETAGLKPNWAICLVAPIALLNVTWINPADPQDPRNHQLKLERDYEAGDIDRFKQRLAFYEDHAYSDPMVRLMARPPRVRRKPAQLGRRVDRRRRAAVRGRTHPGTIPAANPDPTSPICSTAYATRSPPSIRRAAASPTNARSSRTAKPELAEDSLLLRIAGTNPVYEEINAQPLQAAAAFLAGAHSDAGFFDRLERRRTVGRARTGRRPHRNPRRTACRAVGCRSPSPSAGTPPASPS